MARTPSTMPDLGLPAPDFTLPDTDGTLVSRSDYDGRPLLVMFICNHCPFVIHIQQALAEYARDYLDTDLAIVAINANDAERYPDDAPPKMKAEKARLGYPFPYLYDETQEVARAYQAACTPDFFLYDRHHRLAYRGQFDAARPGSPTPATGNDLRAATDAVLAGNPVAGEQLPSLGCNIKWREWPA